MFRRVLIANRGEIAVRIARACRDLGISPVTVHSRADRDSLHVALCDESVEVGGAPARDSYLRAERILEAARVMGAEAIHPGYGFLAENADFAARCEERGFRFVGPTPDAMRRMGDKAAARQAASEIGVPTVPGSGILAPESDGRAEAGALGVPLLVKATAGGGGMGMRVVRDLSELPQRLGEARSEAEAAFGDGRVFLERLVERPRHVEVQVFGDRFGRVVHLGERDCSVQRRNQKLIEESPSPAVDDATRDALGDAAARLASAVSYRNAGTVEFLLDPEGRFYFLEMNTRLQVEHPVTECVTGLDLAALQFRLAAGEPLPFVQEDVETRGAAIELRITAEDPFAGFLPGAGRIGSFRPPLGPGVRCDAGVVSGSRVASHYDPLLAKIIAWGPDREIARRRALRAVRETRLTGVVSTLPFHERALDAPVFRSGDFDTSFVETEWPRLCENQDAPGDLLPFALAAAAARLAGEVPTGPGAPPASRWRDAGLRESHARRL